MRTHFIFTTALTAALGCSLMTSAVVAAKQRNNASMQQQQSAQTSADIPNMGKAPDRPDGTGRVDMRVFDENGNPVRGAYGKLESRRSDGFICEAWNTTDQRGVAVLPPLHIGTISLTIEAPGFVKQTIDLAPSSIGQPVRVTLVRK